MLDLTFYNPPSPTKWCFPGSPFSVSYFHRLRGHISDASLCICHHQNDISLRDLVQKTTSYPEPIILLALLFPSPRPLLTDACSKYSIDLPLTPINTQIPLRHKHSYSTAVLLHNVFLHPVSECYGCRKPFHRTG